MLAKLLKFILLASTSLVMVACDQIRTVDPNDPEGHLKQIEEENKIDEPAIRDYLGIAYRHAMTSLNPNQAISGQDFHTLQLIGEGLYRKEPNGQVVEGVVEDTDYQANEVIFKIKDQAVWQDQEPVKANDFVLSWQNLVDPAQENAYGHLLNGVVKYAEEIQAGELDKDHLAIEAVDDKHFKVVLQADTSIEKLRELFSLPPLFPLPSHHLDGQDDYGSDASYVLSNGPYKISNWQPGWENWNLNKNYEYWKQAAYPTQKMLGMSFNNLGESSQALAHQWVDISFQPSSQPEDLELSYSLLANSFNDDIDQQTPLADEKLKSLILSALDPISISSSLDFPHQMSWQSDEGIASSTINESYQNYIDQKDLQGLELEIMIDLHQSSKQIAEQIQHQWHEKFDHLTINIRSLQTHDLKEKLLNRDFTFAIVSSSLTDEFNGQALLKDFSFTAHPLLSVHFSYDFSSAVKNPEYFESSLYYDFKGLEFQSGEWTQPILEED